jgi:hypothetical protein
MPRFFGLITALLLAGAPCFAQTVPESPRTLRLEQLGNPEVNASSKAAFEQFVQQFGAALTSANLTPPDTLGVRGTSVTADVSVVNLRGNLPTARPYRGPLVIPSMHVRKGLPFSFELGARVGWVDQSRMGAVTAEGRWALNEGFSYLPDVALRGYATRLLGSDVLDLWALGGDVSVGKRIGVFGAAALTPYAGWSLGSVAASSARIDFDPGRSAASELAFPGAGLTNTAPFGAASGGLFYNRFFAGARVQYRIVQLTAEYSYAVLKTTTDATGAKRRPRLPAANVSAGVSF